MHFQNHIPFSDTFTDIGPNPHANRVIDRMLRFTSAGAEQHGRDSNLFRVQIANEPRAIRGHACPHGRRRQPPIVVDDKLIATLLAKNRPELLQASSARKRRADIRLGSFIVTREAGEPQDSPKPRSVMLNVAYPWSSQCCIPDRPALVPP